jgi:tRNA dimethylallyltransferase
MGLTHSKSAILIAGPTASGKSAVAMAVAEAKNGVIINADAMQLYAELHVMTSRPGQADEARVPHRLYGCMPAREVWSAGRWLEAASAEIDAAWAQGKVPVIAGGTGLYFKVLEQGLSAIPPVPDEVRKHWRARLKAEGARALHGELAVVAPADARRLKPGDSQRIVRALEVLEATGKSLGKHFEAANEASILAGADVRRVALTPPRAELYGACDVRFETMMARGALDEVKELLALGLDASLPAMKAIGVQALGAHLAGEASLEDAIALAQRQTRNYAKRQMTWIRNQMTDWPRAEMRRQAIEALLHD